MFNLLKKEVTTATQQTEDLVKKLGDALEVMSGIDAAQQRQIAELQRALSNERESRKRTETEQIRRLKVDNHMLEKEVNRLRVKVDWIENRNTPREFFEPIDRDSLPVRVANVLKNEGIDHYIDLVDKHKRHFLHLPNFGVGSLIKLVDHLKAKFPDSWKHFAVFREWEDEQ